MDKHSQDLFIKTVLANWETTMSRMTAAFDRYSDADLLKPVAAGKNRVVYLLGHLVAVHDRLLPLLRLGERRYPHLDAQFLSNPDNPELPLPPVAELRSQWKELNGILMEKFQAWKPEEWLQRHESVSAADFEKEPHRNRLNVVLSRTGHVSYHHGQIALLKL